MKDGFEKMLTIFLVVIFGHYSTVQNAPKASVITSVYKGKQFIEGFLKDIERQTIFSECEFILINANSPDTQDHDAIMVYAQKYPNIRYVKLDYDPGLYAVWNMAIELAQAAFIANANIDDRLAPNYLETHIQALEENPDVGLVYSDSYYSYKPNLVFEECTVNSTLAKPEFSLENLKHNCLPGNHPMWRKSLHSRYGFFNPSFKIAGDYEMWIRWASNGIRFKKISGVFGAYYLNPKGLSTSNKNIRIIKNELHQIRNLHPLFFDTTILQAHLDNLIS